MGERRTPDFADIMRHIAYIVLAAQRWRDAKGTDDEFRTESVLLEALSLYERDDRLRREALSADKLTVAGSGAGVRMSAAPGALYDDVGVATREERLENALRRIAARCEARLEGLPTNRLEGPLLTLDNILDICEHALGAATPSASTDALGEHPCRRCGTLIADPLNLLDGYCKLCFIGTYPTRDRQQRAIGDALDKLIGEEPS